MLPGRGIGETSSRALPPYSKHVEFILSKLVTRDQNLEWQILLFIDLSNSNKNNIFSNFKAITLICKCSNSKINFFSRWLLTQEEHLESLRC